MAMEMERRRVGCRVASLNLPEIQSSIKMAPLAESSKTIGWSPSPLASRLATRLVRLSASASSASRFRLPVVDSGPERPTTTSVAGAGTAFGLRGISTTFSKDTGFFSSAEGSGLMYLISVQ